MNTPGPPHWTLNTCFGEFRSVWVRLGSFRYCTKLGAIWAELVQLVKQVRTTKSCPNVSDRTHPVHPHWTINSCFGAFHGVWFHLGSFHYRTKHGANWVEAVQLVQKFVPWSCDWIFSNECNQSNKTLNSCFCAFRIVWVHLWSFYYCTKLGEK